MKNFEKKGFIQAFSPFVIFGVVMILVPIFVFMTMDNIREQNGRTIEKLTGKGIFLIRAFEAGTRSGMATMRWGVARVQNLLTETALQPEVEYMMITDSNGKILAHSDPSLVGHKYMNMPDIKALNSDSLYWHREIASENGKKVFQIFKKFTPAHRRFGAAPGLKPPRTICIIDEKTGEVDCDTDRTSASAANTMGRHGHREKSGLHEGEGLPGGGSAGSGMVASQEKDKKDQSLDDKDAKDSDARRAMEMDWFRIHFFPPSPYMGGAFEEQNQIIFAALDMSEVDIAKAKYLKHVTAMALMFFVLGCSGILGILAFQGYRSARSSLYRVKAFSDRVVENMPVGLITMDEEMFISFHNGAAMSILGYPGDFPEGTTVNCQTPIGVEYLPPELLDMAKELFALQENGRKNVKLAREILCTCIDGRKILLEINASPIWNDDGDGIECVHCISGFLFLFQDITELKELKSEIERSRRLASVGKLAAGVAHEIRNPLSSIKGFATYFRERYCEVKDDKEVAEIMIQEVERLNRAVTQLLEFAKPLPVVAKKVNLNELITHSARLVEHDLKRKGIKMTIDNLLLRESIMTDPDRLSQILLNLYLNAMEAMDEGGELTVRLSEMDAQERDGLYPVHDSDLDSKIMVEIVDTGKGIEEKDIDHIFDPYFTTRACGTGLGLAMVHRAIEALGADIRVESARGEGTTFFIRLPC